MSQIAKDKHELELRVKRLESAEIDLKRLTDVNRNLELSNASLRVRLPPAFPSFLVPFHQLVSCLVLLSRFHCSFISSPLPLAYDQAQETEGEFPNQVRV